METFQGFANRDYRQVIEEVIARHAGIRGFQSRLAAACGCQKSYFSRVLKGKANLSEDQAFALAAFVGFSALESEILLLLVSYARASHGPYRDFLERKLDSRVEEQRRLVNKLGDVDVPVDGDHDFYYASWFWAAIHILAGVPGFHHEQRIAEALQIPVDLTRRCLKKMAKHGFVRQVDGGWQVAKGNIHQPGDRLNILPYHQSWRTKALALQPYNRPEDIFYTSIQSVSEDDLARIHTGLQTVIAKTRQDFIRCKKKETVVGFNLDFFRLV